MGTIASEAGTDAIIDSARALRPLIESLRDEMEVERRMPAPLVQAMADARLFHLLVPRSIGGLEVDPVTYMRATEEVARVDGSAGWNLMIGAGDGFISGFVPERVAKEVFGPNDVVAGVLAPTGKAIATDGGYRVSGRWSFASGIRHATWAFGTCVVYDGDTPRTVADDVPFLQMVLVPASDCEIHDTWHVSGLRGTGSEDFSISDLFVPDERAFLLFFSERYQDGTLFKMPPTFFNAAIAAVPLGIARAAIDALVDMATTKVPSRFGSRKPLRERAGTHVAIAQAEALLGSARAYFYQALEEVWETVKAGDSASMEQRAKLRLATCHAAIACAQAVDLAYNTGGGTSIYERSLLQRCFRDIHVATQHPAVAPDGMEDAGRILFGLPPSSPIF